MSIRDERKQQSRQALLDAALALSGQGRAFSSMSLREIAKAANLVPTAFYRHFSDMDELGLELVDQTALQLKQMQYQMGQVFQHQPDTRIQNCIHLLFQHIQMHPEPWIFFIAERWGGSARLRYAIQREIQYLTADLSADLGRTQTLNHIHLQHDLQVLSQILMSLAFNWAMSWMDLQRSVAAAELGAQQEQLKLSAITQVQLLFRGILHWDRNQPSA